jgi:1-acyl-sn-glycerol-3-phosphate acyltransferase
LLRPAFAVMGRSGKYRLGVDGTENVPRSGPLIVVSNHQFSTDVIIIALALKPALTHSHMRPWAKRAIGEGKEGFLGKLMWNLFGVIPVDREEGNAEEVIRTSLECLKRREIVHVFPEGTRCGRKELGWLRYGVANLARAAPAPILPVGLYHRDSDGGVQVNIGKPFFMPPRKTVLERLEELESRAEEKVSHQIEALRQWSASIDRDRKGMRMIARIIRIIADFVDRQDIDFNRFCRMAEEEDNEFIRDRVYELLPPDWARLEAPDKVKAAFSALPVSGIEG